MEDGNLGYPSLGAATDGMWPCTFDTFDICTFLNQNWENGSGLAAALRTDNGQSKTVSTPHS